jgi:hypothetical protein
MDPITGRFVGEDAERDGANWFAYASGNPVSNVDSTGGSAQEVTVYIMLILSKLNSFLDATDSKQAILSGLRILMRKLSAIISVSEIGASEAFAASEETEAASWFASDPTIHSVIQDLREAQRALGARELGYSAAARIARQGIKIAMELIDLE